MTNVGVELISSRENNNIKALVKLLSSKKERRELGLFVVEGVRLSIDALKSGVEIKELYYTEEAFNKYEAEITLLKASSQKVSMISEQLSEKISDTQTPQGVYAVCVMNISDKMPSISSTDRYILLSSLQDPGNLGTIIRSCEAFGITGIIMSQDCPDIYSPKVLRSAMGGVFRQTIITVLDMDELILKLKSEGVSVYGAALSDKAIPISEIDKTTAIAVVIGNEGNGLKESTINSCNNAVIIPMKSTAESLNASIAASIIAFEITK